MKKTEITEVHVRKCRIVLDNAELFTLIKNRAIELTGFTETVTTVEIKVEDVTDSLSYKRGVRCVVDLTEDQTRLPVMGDAP